MLLLSTIRLIKDRRCDRRKRDVYTYPRLGQTIYWQLLRRPTDRTLRYHVVFAARDSRGSSSDYYT